MTPGQLIKKHREKLGMTQLELARKLGYEIPQFCSLMENGHSKVPVDICKKIIRILKIDRDILKISMLNEYSKILDSKL